MRARTKGLLAAVGGLFALWVGWGTYVNRTTERVPFETLDRFDGVEIRRYPQTILVETTAENRETAFRSLFRYISGANEPREKVAMTAPVATRSEKVSVTAPVRTLHPRSESVAMTAPVRTTSGEGTVTMAFSLPERYTPETAPTPTDPAVKLVVEPPRTAAVRQFSWYATDRRVDRERRRLLDTLARRGLETDEEPVLLQYNDPWTPPFMRRNEIEVSVEEPE